MVPLLFTLTWASESTGEQIARRTAVVELFTSEGCHSCPPADLLLGQLAAREWDNGKVYALAFHVDYWNGLGWVDRLNTTRKGLDFNVALVERQASSDVKRGENAWKPLDHSYVVRSHAVIAVSADPIGKTELKIPNDTAAAALDAIAYVQDRATMTVLGAVSVPLSRGG